MRSNESELKSPQSQTSDVLLRSVVDQAEAVVKGWKSVSAELIETQVLHRKASNATTDTTTTDTTNSSTVTTKQLFLVDKTFREHSTFSKRSSNQEPTYEIRTRQWDGAILLENSGLNNYKIFRDGPTPTVISDPFQPILNQLGLQMGMIDFLSLNDSATQSNLLKTSLEASQLNETTARIVRRSKIVGSLKTKIISMDMEIMPSLRILRGESFQQSESGERSDSIYIDSIYYFNMKQSSGYEFTVNKNRSDEPNKSKDGMSTNVRFHWEALPAAITFDDIRIKEISTGSILEEYSEGAWISAEPYRKPVQREPSDWTTIEIWLMINNILFGLIFMAFCIWKGSQWMSRLLKRPMNAKV